MRFANTLKKVTVVMITVMQLFLVSAYAGETVGKVTAVDYGAGTVSINGVRYQFATDTSEKGVKEVSSLRYGQIVTYSAEKGVITKISIMPGVREIPM